MVLRWRCVIIVKMLPCIIVFMRWYYLSRLKKTDLSGGSGCLKNVYKVETNNLLEKRNYQWRQSWPWINPCLNNNLVKRIWDPKGLFLSFLESGIWDFIILALVFIFILISSFYFGRFAPLFCTSSTQVLYSFWKKKCHQHLVFLGGTHLIMPKPNIA